MLIQLSIHFDGNSPMIQCVLMHVGKIESPAGITRIAGGFSVLREFYHGLDITFEKTSSSYVLVTETPAIRAPTICPFSNSDRLRILT